MPRLLIQTPDGKSLVYEVVKPRITIGRAEKNDLVLSDLNASRVHATVELGAEGYRIVDQHSRNGTFVDNRRCTEAALENGSVIRLGDTILKFEEATAAWAKMTAAQPAAGLLAAGEERDLLRATQMFRRLSPQAEAPGEAKAVPPPDDAVSRHKQLHEAQRRALLFEVVSHARRLFQEASGPEEVLNTIPKLIRAATQAERVVVMLWDEEKSCLQPAGIHAPGSGGAGGFEPATSELALSRTILNTVLKSRQAVLIGDVRAEPELALKESVMLSGLRSAACVPMATQDKLYGLIYVDNQQTPQVFDQDDLQMLALLSQEGAIALLTARTREEHIKQEQTRQAYRRFLPEHLAEMLIAHPDAVSLGGARQVVTVLFADLRGFTSLAERLQPEEAVGLLNSFFAEMTSVVFRHGGTLDKYLGDGLLAVFGAPLSGPSDPLRAVQCAIDMQETLDELCHEWQAQNRPSIPMGIGVNTGEAIVGNIGSSLHMEYTVIGDTVNVAARLTQHAGPGEILMGEPTFRQIDGQIPAECLPPLMLKGKREPSSVYRVLRSKSGLAGQ